MMTKHIIYKTTNLLNGRYYIGMHSTANINDGYLGSGRRIKAEIKKYGRENFVRIVLEELPSKEELSRREAELVTEKLRADPLCLNLKNGGKGGQSKEVMAEVWQRREFRQRHKDALKKKFEDDEVYRASLTAHSSQTMKNTHAAGKINYATFTGRKHTEETLAKMRASHAARRQRNSATQS